MSKKSSTKKPKLVERLEPTGSRIPDGASIKERVQYVLNECEKVKITEVAFNASHDSVPVSLTCPAHYCSRSVFTTGTETVDRTVNGKKVNGYTWPPIWKIADNAGLKTEGGNTDQCFILSAVPSQVWLFRDGAWVKVA